MGLGLPFLQVWPEYDLKMLHFVEKIVEGMGDDQQSQQIMKLISLLASFESLPDGRVHVAGGRPVTTFELSLKSILFDLWKESLLKVLVYLLDGWQVVLTLIVKSKELDLIVRCVFSHFLLHFFELRIQGILLPSFVWVLFVQSLHTQIFLEFPQQDHIVLQQVVVEHEHLVTLEQISSGLNQIDRVSQKVNLVLLPSQQLLLLFQLFRSSVKSAHLDGRIFHLLIDEGLLGLGRELEQINPLAISYLGSFVDLGKMFLEDGVFSQLYEGQPLCLVDLKDPGEEVLHLRSAVFLLLELGIANCSFVAKLIGQLSQIDPLFLLTSDKRQLQGQSILTERKFLVDHRKEQHPKSPHVNLKAVLLLQEYLRGLELISTQVSPFRLFLRLAETKIGQFKHLFTILFCYQNVLRLDVPMHVPLAVKVLQSLADIYKHINGLLHWEHPIKKVALVV